MKIIKITNETQLYQALADGNNTGSTLELAPGHYKLDAVKGSTSGGRIEFLHEMSIRGAINDASKVIIDASLLPGGSFNPAGGFPGRTGAIRMGFGHNTLEWVTVIGSPTSTALSVIDTDLITPNVPSYVNILHCIITKGRIGINVRNVGTPSNYRIVHAKIEDNVIRDNTVSQAGTQQGQGIVVQHANGVSNGQLHVTMHNNHVHHNTMGMRLFNNTSNTQVETCDNKIFVSSENDRFVDNKLGMYIQGSSNNVAGTTCDRNEVDFTAIKSLIQNNSGIMPDPIVLPCGIFIVGGGKQMSGSPTSDNRVSVKLKDCQLSGNQDFDIRAFGAFSGSTQPPAEPAGPLPSPGSNNHVDIKLMGQSNSAMTWAMDCFPAYPASGDNVNIK